MWTTPHKRMTVRIPPGLYRAVEKAATDRGMTVNEFITKVLKDDTRGEDQGEGQA